MQPDLQNPCNMKGNFGNEIIVVQ